jgi:hypothetical protein
MCILCHGIVQKLLEHGLVSKGNVAMCAKETEDALLRSYAEFEATTRDMSTEQIKNMTEQVKHPKHAGVYDA